MNSRAQIAVASVMSTEDTCGTCGLRYSHWYHYYSDIYGAFLFHRCPKLTPLNNTISKPKTGGCWYFFKFVLWFLLIPLLTFIVVVISIFNVFKTFMFTPLHFEYSNMNRQQLCRYRLPVILLYAILGFVLFLCELILPLLVTPLCIPLMYFVHVYGFVAQGRFRRAVRRLLMQ